MKTAIKSLLLLMIVLAGILPLQAADYGTFEGFYEISTLSPGMWALIVIGTIGVVAITFLTFGGGASAAPAWMTAVGTWIGSTVGLSGAAAANFGLALLGGGSVAAGGLGVAGGVAVLTAAMSLSVEVATYSSAIALEKWERSKYIELNKDMLTLPLPRNENGGDAYEYVVEMLNKDYDKELSISDAKNQKVLCKARDELVMKMKNEKDKEYKLKDMTMLALLELQRNSYSQAASYAQLAMKHAVSTSQNDSLPSFIWALSCLANPDICCTDSIIQALRKAYTLEPENQLIALMTACCLDRLIYKYHYGQLPVEHLSSFFNIITDSKIEEKLSYAAVEIYVIRCLIEMRRTKEDIHIIVQDKDMMMKDEVVNEVRMRYARHRQLLSMMLKQILPYVLEHSSDFPKESKLRELNLPSLLDEYYANLEKMGKEISDNQSFSLTEQPISSDVAK